jgi:DNA invertase Pin-like site-specific DNA recombinase
MDSNMETETKRIRVVLYIRVSSPEQNTNMQRLIVENYANECDYEIVKIIEEKGSAYGTTITHNLYEFLLNLDSFESFDKIVVYSFDRLSRNVINGIEIVQLFEQHNITIESVADNVDYTTPFGRKCLIEKFVAAQYESDVKSFRSRETMRWKRNFGLYVGKAPYGYRIEPVHKKELIVNQNEMRIIDFIKAAQQTDVSTEEINEMFNEIKAFTKQQENRQSENDSETEYEIKQEPPLSVKEISDLLNQTNIRKRKRSWTPTGVRYLSKRQCH